MSSRGSGSGQLIDPLPMFATCWGGVHYAGETTVGKDCEMVPRAVRALFGAGRATGEHFASVGGEVLEFGEIKGHGSDWLEVDSAKAATMAAGAIKAVRTTDAV
jgi:hypothetical protein